MCSKTAFNDNFKVRKQFLYNKINTHKFHNNLIKYYPKLIFPKH